MQLKFSKSVSMLYGPVLTAKVIHEEEDIDFKITPDIFCRDWYEVSCCYGLKNITLARYVSKIEDAIKICEDTLKEIRST